ncbi:MAG: AI-2E family transporter [Prochlorotrichaceae cyanobacterium]
MGQWVGILIVGMALYVLWQIRQLILILFTAIVLSTAVNSLVRLLSKRAKIPRKRSIWLVLALIFVVAVLFITLVIPPFITQFQQLIRLVPLGLEKAWLSLPRWLDWLVQQIPDRFVEARSMLGLLQEQIQRDGVDMNLSQLDFPELSQQASPIVTKFLENFFSVFNNAITITLQFILTLVLSILLLVNPGAYRSAALLLFPSFYRRRGDEILTACEESLCNWFAGIFISSLFVGVSSGAVLALLGIKFAFAHALLAGLLNFIPNIGPALSVVFPLSIALQNPSWNILWIVVAYFIIQNVETYGVTPTIMARQVSLLPALTLIAQIFFATVFGIIGLILALPLAVVSKVWIEELLVHDILDRWHQPS